MKCSNKIPHMVNNLHAKDFLIETITTARSYFVFSLKGRWCYNLILLEGNHFEEDLRSSTLLQSAKTSPLKWLPSRCNKIFCFCSPPWTWIRNWRNRPFAANDHVVQNLPCWRASSFLFPHWDIKTKASQASLVQVSLFQRPSAGIIMSLPSSMADFCTTWSLVAKGL